MAEKNPPVIKFNDGQLGMAVFKQTKEDGKSYYSVCLQRSYKKKGSEEWSRESVNMFPDDLLKVAELARLSYNGLVEYLHKNKAEEKEYPQQAIDDEVPFWGVP